MKKLGVASLLLATALFFYGCKGGSADPKGVADKFWSASKEGNVEQAKPYVTKASLEMLKQGKSEGFQKGGEYQLGEVKLEGDKAWVTTTLKDTNTNSSFPLQTVLVKEGRDWKVDVSETMMSMFGGAMGEMMKGLGEGLAKGMQEGTEGMAGEMKGAMEQTTPDANANAPVANAAPAQKTFNTGDKVLVEWNGAWEPSTVLECNDAQCRVQLDSKTDVAPEWIGFNRIRGQ